MSYNIQKVFYWNKYAQYFNASIIMPCGITLDRAVPDLPTPQTEKSILHNIRGENILVGYRSDESEEDPYVFGSYDLAAYYARLRGVPEDNLIPLPCFSHDRILTQDQFHEQIYNPLLSAIQGEYGDHTEKLILGIVLSFNVPYMYKTDNDELIAITSRLHTIGHEFNIHQLNHTYDRKDWQFFNANDRTKLAITSHLTSPCFEVSKLLINRSVELDNESNINGKFFIDPYGKKDTAYQIQYENDILDFVNRDLDSLGLKTDITVDFDDPYLEPQVHKLISDSFYWGWFTDRISVSMFEEGSAKRVFLYNADNDAASRLHLPTSVDNSDTWCNSAISFNDGYTSCAGTVGDPNDDAYVPVVEDAHLRPRPFFEALHRGSCLGEAFLFASKYVNWKVMLIGDPLMTVNFPLDFVPHTLRNREAISLIKRDIEDGYAWGLRQDQLLEYVVNKVEDSDNLSEQLFLLDPLLQWQTNKNIDSQKNIFYRAVKSMLDYVIQSEGLTFVEWMHNNSEQVSQYLHTLISQEVSNASEFDTDFDIYPEGQWERTFTYNHPKLTLERVFFTLEISSDSNFGSELLIFNSWDFASGWQFEKEFYDFYDIPREGMWSNYSSRRIRFTSPRLSYLTSLDPYYYRWRATDENGSVLIDWSTPVRFIVSR